MKKQFEIGDCVRCTSLVSGDEHYGIAVGSIGWVYRAVKGKQDYYIKWVAAGTDSHRRTMYEYQLEKVDAE